MLHAGIGVQVNALDSGIEIADAKVSVRFERLTSAVAKAVTTIVTAGVSKSHCVDSIRSEEGSDAVAQFHYCLKLLMDARLLCASVQASDRLLATWQPGDRRRGARPFPLESSERYSLSRFAFLRPSSEGLVLETAIDSDQLVIGDNSVLVLLAALAQPSTIDCLAVRCADLPRRALLGLLQILGDGGFLAGNDSSTAESQVPASWEFHDLLFHTRSRLGRHHQPTGSTYRFLGRSSSPPALLPAPAAESVIELARTAENGSAATAFDELMQTRHSLRQYGRNPITIAQLGAFLYSVFRVTHVENIFRQTPSGTVETEVAHRRYPGGGGLYEFEVYVAVQRCDGLEPGLYRYIPQLHGLHAHAKGIEVISRIVQRATFAANIEPKDGQLLIVLAARFPRIAWKYESIAYATILKNAGVIMQTMYLAATAMQLAPCALGCGDSEEFARVSGADYYHEGSVAEFLLGSR